MSKRWWSCLDAYCRPGQASEAGRVVYKAWLAGLGQDFMQSTHGLHTAVRCLLADSTQKAVQGCRTVSKTWLAGIHPHPLESKLDASLSSGLNMSERACRHTTAAAQAGGAEQRGDGRLARHRAQGGPQLGFRSASKATPAWLQHKCQACGQHASIVSHCRPSRLL